MDIIAVSYHNIGPFLQQHISIFLHKGKFLIKAPIGSGKSFLFFDGPMFGLYKLTQRKMLHTQAEQGTIKVLFTMHGNYYLVCRELKTSKVKESCSSKLYAINQEGIADRLFGLYTDVLYHDLDIEKVLKDMKVSLEQIVFKNEQDLQQSLNDLLPPKEVLMSTSLLMQDSESIFAYTPADRLLVLKNIFGLLGIDHAKDIIAERKKDVAHQKNIKMDTGRLSMKLQQYMGNYAQAMKVAKEYLTIAEPETLSQFFTELEVAGDKLAIENFAANTIDPVRHSVYANHVNQQMSQRQIYAQEISGQEKVLHNYRTQAEGLQQQLHKDNQELDSIRKHIQGVKTMDIDLLREQIKTLLVKQEALNLDAKSYEQVSRFIAKHADLDLPEHCSTLADLAQLINHLIYTGKQLQQQKTTAQEEAKLYETQKQTLQSHIKQYHYEQGTEMYRDIQQQIQRQQAVWQQEKSLIAKEIESLEEKKKWYDESLDKLQKAAQGDQQTIARCVQEIRKALPSIDDSAAITVEQILHKYMSNEVDAEQITKLKEEIQTMDFAATIRTLKEKGNEYDQHIAAISTEPEKFLADIFAYWQHKREDIEKDLRNLESHIKAQPHNTRIQDIDTKIQAIKAFLDEIGRKDIQARASAYETLSKEVKSLEAQVDDHNKQEEAITQQQKQIEKLEHTIHIGQQQLERIHKQIVTVQQELEALQAKQATVQQDKLLEASTLLDKAGQAYAHIQELVDEYAHVKVAVKQLQEQEKILGNLYTLFSKELLLLVLSENIPTLNDIINVYLAQVVDYQLDMQIVKGSGDKLELQAMIHDERGRREVKSLSTGQKTILKLVRMLAIASYLRTPMLFLDETINHIDTDTVGKVADMITDFVKQQHIKFYTVTHNERIQDMQIWDSVVTL